MIVGHVSEVRVTQEINHRDGHFAPSNLIYLIKMRPKTS